MQRFRDRGPNECRQMYCTNCEYEASTWIPMQRDLHRNIYFCSTSAFTPLKGFLLATNSRPTATTNWWYLHLTCLRGFNTRRHTIRLVFDRPSTWDSREPACIITELSCCLWQCRLGWRARPIGAGVHMQLVQSAFHCRTLDPGSAAGAPP